MLSRCKAWNKAHNRPKRRNRARKVNLPNTKNSYKVSPELILPLEELFCPDLVREQVTYEKRKVDKLANFGRSHGDFKSTYETVVRVDYDFVVIEKHIQIETVEDLLSGKRVRADTSMDGPPGYRITWGGLAKLVELDVGCALPFNRLALMLSTSSCPLSTTRLAKLHSFVAEILAPVYLALPEVLSEAEIVSGDDSPTRVLETECEDPNTDRSKKERSNLIMECEDLLGHTFAKASAQGKKKQINISLIVGKTKEDDPHSYVYFYRTHRGSFGNLLTKFLELRKPANKVVTVHSDLSSSNKPSAPMQNKFNIDYVGCGSHSRRYFFRSRKYDEGFVYYILRAFAILSHIERRIEVQGPNEEVAIRYRKRYSQRVWRILKDHCERILSGERAISGSRWPPDSKIHQACKYLVNHYEKLTKYLSNPKLQMTNNLVERLLRSEKILLNNCKFRKSEHGRVVVDILRTMVHTCRAADVSFVDYLMWIFLSDDDVAKKPLDYSPYAFRLYSLAIKLSAANAA